MKYIIKNSLPIILILLSLIGKISFSQTFNFKNYNTEQGLPQSQVLCIHQDHNGNMWFGTNSGGVGKYDGNKFTIISDNDGLINNVVFSIIENDKNELLFGTSKGLSIYNGFTFKNFGEKDGLANSWIFKLVSDGDKTWIGTQEGVYILQNDKIRRFRFDPILDKSSVFSIFIDSKKRIWFATTNNGAICYNPTTNNFSHFNKSNGLQENFVFSLAESENKEILIGTIGGVNIVNEKNEVRICDYIPRQFYVGFRSIISNSKKEHWYGTSSEGLYKYIENGLHVYNLKNGLTNNTILSLCTDREGNTWIGTDGSGVYKYSGDRFVSYSKQNGLLDNYINAVAQDKNGMYWAALRNNGLALIDGQNITSFKFEENNKNAIPDNDILTMLSVDDGRMFFGTKQGLCIYYNGIFKTISDFGFRQKYILSLFQDKNKNVWIGTTDGLFKYTNGIIEEEKSIIGFKQSGIQFSIFCISQDKNGDMWAGTENGAIRFNSTKASIYNESTGFISKRISAIITDDHQKIWFGTEDGVFNYDNSSFKKISKKNGLSSNFINFLQLDTKNRLFIGLNTGIDILNLNDFYNNKVTIQHFGKDDGLISVESNSNASCLDKDGRILIGTINGLEIYNPKYDTKNIQEAITKINHVKLFFGQENILKYSKSIDSTSVLPKSLKLPFNKNHLTFQFIGVSLTAPEKVMYQFKLDGVDNDWTPPTSKTEATYSSLPPGHYTFMVKAMNNDGIWNKEPVIFEFDILAPWYKTWWFYTICVLILIGSISLYNYVKTKKLIADKQKLEHTVDERTRELRDEKEKVEVINKEVIEQKTIIEHKNIEITDSIKYAKNIQEALLPNLNEIGNLFPNSFVLYMPKDIVSGDFYWFAKNGDTSFIAAVDCTGHGVPGAFMSIVGNTILNEIVNDQKITKPGDILLELHKGVKVALHQSNKEFERRDGMDMTLCAITKGSSIIQYAGANRPLWIYRKNKAYELEIIKATKFPIGGLELEENRIYQNHEIAVDEGDCLYLFSDGYADQFGGPKGKKFMLTNLQKTIFDCVEMPMNVQKQKLVNAFIDWKKDTEQIDDVLVIGVKI